MRFELRQHFLPVGCKMGAGVIQMNFHDQNLFRLVCVGVMLPLLLFLTVVQLDREMTSPIQPSTGAETTPSQPNEQLQPMLSVLYGGSVQKMELESYLVGVVLAEMPASFEPQALRAQAVAARTYTIKHCQEDLRHGENIICTEHSCCQAFIDPRDYVRDGGSWSSVERVRQAVTDTVGQVLVYDGELIVATYFSCAGGLTEDAAAVWGQEVPYLQSVPSPGEEKATYYIDSKTFTAQQFQTALGIRLKGEVSSWFGEVTFTDGGGVKTMEIGGVSYRGTTLRTLLELRSTAFSVSFQDDTVTFHTRGFGHRVGMSQYGANAMAEEGRTYQEILAHYYCGTEIVHYCI